MDKKRLGLLACLAALLAIQGLISGGQTTLAGEPGGLPTQAALPTGDTGDCATPEAIAAFEAGQAHLEAGRQDKAIAEFERAAALYPDFDDAWFLLNQIYPSLNRYEDAIRTAEQLMRLNPGMAESFQWEIDRYRSLAETPEAALAALARCRRHEAGSKQGISACREAIEIYPEYADAHYFLGVHYIHAGDEDSAKEIVAALIPLDPDGASPLLLHVMSVVRPEWMSEAYGKELNLIYANVRTPRRASREEKQDYLQFSAEEIRQILAAYAEQIAALRSLLDELPGLIPADCAAQGSADLRARLRQTLTEKSFFRVETRREGCGPSPRMNVLLDSREFRGLVETTTVARGLDLGNPARETWRVGLVQEWIREDYCRPRCAPIFEFRIDTDVDGDRIRVSASVEALPAAGNIARCTGSFGEAPRNLDW